jgi:hypothetical protein
MKSVGRRIAISVAPSLMMVSLFYSLAIHMRWSLGKWPSSIGEGGFPGPLIAHAYVAVHFFVVLLLLSFFVAPGVLLICLLVPRWRASAPYFALFLGAFFLGWGLMQLAPEPFLYWWRD